ncbi:hypothetical protein MRB53_008894 [Persea americana]|uniref:Uncharacterized protein n=1 Tax=Persea americana TaxID=3435 RepID=A0ACC2LMK3_PERAE|nr:hypothetical protein MRB53_008894 [Persea americana]
MTRGKRVLDSNNNGEENQPEIKKQKSPVLACVILEAFKGDSLQKRCSLMEPFLRGIVREETESAFSKFGPAMVGERLPPKQIQGSNGRKLGLRFQSKLPDKIFTGTEVVGEGGAEIRVVLIDMSTSDVVRSGPESCARLLVVVLKGDFNNEDDGDWPWEEFERHVMKEREGKRPLLTGDLKVSLKEGVGSLGKFTFTDNSRWTPIGKFRLGVKVESGFCEGIHVRGAKTNAFIVKDHRGESYKKNYPPSWNDEVWRLEEIRKDGSYQKRLNEGGISTVEDFLRRLVRDPEGLKKILGGRMSDKKWHIIVKHAKTCLLNPRIHYVYYYDNNTKNNCIVFNSIYEFSGLIAGGQSYTTETLPDSEKEFVDALVNEAYDNWKHIVECDGRKLLNMKQNETASSFQTGQQVSIYPPSFVPSEQASMNSGQVIRDDPFYSGEQVFAPHQPSSVPVVPANSEPAVGGDMGLEEEFCLEDYICPPPCKYLTLRLMLFCVVRFKRAVAGRLVELRD